MLGASFDRQTSFENAIVPGLSVDRYALECLANYGDLTVGARMTMKINDDVARLRAAYSGFWQWIHLAAVFGFLFPYAWFIACLSG